MTSSPLLLALGDSLVAGYGLAAADAFPVQLERSLRRSSPQACVLNAGMSGDTAGDALRRLPGVLSRLDRRPDLAIVQVGPNDMLRQVPPGRTRADLDAILGELGRCAVPVLVTTVEPPAFLRARADGYLAIHAEVAARHGAALWPFFPAGVLGHPAMVIGDRVHPNARAIAAVIDAMLPEVERLLAGRRRAA